MAFYDAVKEDIRDETQDQDEEEDGNMPFDQLKDEAEEREDPEEASGSDTDIEVLGGGTDDSNDSTASPSSAADSPSSPGPAAEADPGSADSGDTAQPGTDRDVVQLLQRIERQNDEMLDVLRGIKRSLE